MTEDLSLRAGFELELLAPPGSSRRVLADELARRFGGSVRQVWHEDSEPSLVEALGGRFLHLTQGFEVSDADRHPVATLVDDITIVAGLNPRAPAPAGWQRILTDEPRLLRLLARHSDPGDPLETLLDRVARLFGAETERLGSIWRLDSHGATVALAAPAGAERERPCEVVTVPLATGHREALAALLEPARELGFTVPVEAAVHIHVDGAPFRDPAALANVVRLFGWWREPLRELLETNASCKRLAPLPVQLVDAAAVAGPTIDGLRAAAKDGGLSKFFDVNLTQVLSDRPLRDTVEIRILPGSIDTDEVIRRAVVVERLLLRCLETEPFPVAPTDPAAARATLSGLARSSPRERR